MRHPRRAPRCLKAALAAVVLLVVGACRAQGPPPTAEFLVSAGDSTYWIRTDTTGVRVRGSPILLARYGGQFYEVYVTDDDRSFRDAAFVGQRIYRRDLVTGDATRRGVLDLRTGEPASLALLFGNATAALVTRQARLAYLAAIDSVFRSES